MSSTYRILCLSHDPAMVIDRDFRSPEDAEAAVAAGLDGHPHCDLAIGAFSYPLVNVGCLAARIRLVEHSCYHGSTQWIDRDWLRLLAAGYQTTDPLVDAVVKRVTTLCWPWERLRRLREELEIELRQAEEPS